MTTENGIAQPAWQVPVNREPAEKLKVYNSMTRSKDIFEPIKGNQVGWYCCGPTVYDASHMGHARAYITFDILRRIMEDYFNYNVLYVMNITDIDDKIILGARYRHLYETFKKQNPTITQTVLDEVADAWSWFVSAKFQVASFAEWPAFAEKVTNNQVAKEDPKFDVYFKMAQAAYSAYTSSKKDTPSEHLLESAKDALARYLDKKLGASVTDPVLFRDFSAFWEDAYFKDMDDLNIRRPDVLTRVSEYVPEIVSYVQKIITNGFAYEVNGSVYFDTVKFDRHPNHSYAKLEPWSAGDVKKMQEGEGDLATDEQGKRNKSDFALWKASKPGEPAWASPWGQGRPGWHIECSAMASEVLGEQLDIHSGGIDLAFPHHDNELAQAEAHYDCKQWVNYFVHAGHLHIEGQKMSKSLKNFVTIQEAIARYSANQIRLMFLLHQWDAVLDFKDASMTEAKDYESKLLNFFALVKSLQRAESNKAFDGNHNFHEKEMKFLAAFEAKQQAVHKALCDSFNTPTALFEIRELMSAFHVYYQDKTRSGETVNVRLVTKVAAYVTRMFKVFGMGSEEHDEIGFASKKSAVNVEDVAMPFMHVMSTFRDTVRKLAQEKATHVDFLKLCDKLRDDDLIELGVVLDDQSDGRAVVKFVDREVLIKQREEKKQREEQKRLEKEARAKAELEKKLAKLEKGKLKPTEMFLTEEGKQLYSKWDENGLPTHDVHGEEVAKAKRKKLQKEYDVQVKLHNEYLAHVNAQN